MIVEIFAQDQVKRIDNVIDYWLEKMSKLDALTVTNGVETVSVLLGAGVMYSIINEEGDLVNDESNQKGGKDKNTSENSESLKSNSDGEKH